MLEFSHDPVDLFGYTLGYRYSHDDRVAAHTFYPTLSLHVWRFDIEPTVLVTLTSDGQTSLTGRLKLIYHISERGAVEAAQVADRRRREEAGVDDDHDAQHRRGAQHDPGQPGQGATDAEGTGDGGR